MVQDSTLSPQPALLGLLTISPRHPYELHQEYSRELGGIWHIGKSHLYAYLKQLTSAGLVAVTVEAQPNRPDRTVYCLTSDGQETFLNWLHQLTPHVRHFRLEFLMRLYFFRRLGLPGLEQLTADQKALFKSRVESLHQAAAKADDEYWRLVLAFRESETQAIVNWLERCLGDTIATVA